MKKIIITGGSGLLGSHIAKTLQQHNYEPALLTRRQNSKIPYRQFLWDPKAGTIDENVFKECDAIMHLAGANVAGNRWTKAYKEEIISSRVESARLLHNTMDRIQKKIKAFISASASGYYPANATILLEEHMPPADSFLGATCRQWEAAADTFQSNADRVVKFRIGIVLSAQGGALQVMHRSMPFRVSGIFGNGRQIYPWIHIADAAHMFMYALQQPLQGAYNAVAPETSSLLDIISNLEQAIGHKTLHLPAPQFVLRTLLGEFADSLYASQHISSKKITDAGYRFQYPTLQQAIRSLYGSKPC